MNDIDKNIYIKYGQLNIKNNNQISKINNIEVNNNVDFFKLKELSPYCDTTYGLLVTTTKTNTVPYNEYLQVNEHCNK